MFRYLLFLFLPIASFTQTISGNIKNNNNEFVYGATITITKILSDEVIGYDISDANGNYTIKIDSPHERLNITVRILGYKKETKLIINQNQRIDFILIPKITKLKEVVVKIDRITKTRDTIDYRVSSFASKKDRTIADVIAKMPGIEVLSSGKILYQGKPINKYYIEGLDLLEGRYNLANKNLPYSQVSKVQILENHQPIKILDSLVFSDNAALNIKLKNNVSLTGQGKLGVGMRPILWENNITPMLFSNKAQVISSYQTNNTGNDISSQLKVLTIDDLEGVIEDNSKKKDWLSIQKIIPPRFSKNKWLNNNIHIISFNSLHQLKNDLNLRLNSSYLNDFQKQEGNKNTIFFVNNDTIKIYENTFNSLFNNSLKTNVTVEKNTKSNFFKSSLNYQGFWDSQKGLVNTNNSSVFQDLKNHYFIISNNLQNIFNIGGKLMTLNSFVSYDKTPQALRINPGQFKDILNNDSDFVDLKQRVDLSRLYLNNSINFTKGIKQYTFTSRVGFQLENQYLTSTINTDGTELLNNEFNNNLEWIRGKTFFDLKSQFEKGKWRIQLDAPLSFNYFNVKDNSLERNEELNKLIFEPRLFIINNINPHWKISGALGIRNDFGKISNIYNAYIVKNYRNIQRVNSPIPTLLVQNYDIGFSYRNQIKSLFGNIYYSYSNSKNNILFNTQIAANGNVELEAVDRNNNKKTHAIFGRISRYISNIKTSFTFKASFNSNDFIQILNSDLVDINTQNHNFNLKINTDITDWFDIEYQGALDVSKSKIQKKNNRAVNNQRHLFEFNLYPVNNQFLGLNVEFMRNDLFSTKNNYFFSDLVYRYTLKKIGVDFELLYSNIFNTKNYQTINVNDFTYVETNFILRPSQIVLKARFSL